MEFFTHANRGNVAVICWNTLNASTWYVTSENLDGEVSLGKDAQSLLAINFNDFTTKDGALKEIEEVSVKVVPSMDKEIGSRQIVIDSAKIAALYKNVADYESEFKTVPKKNEDESTYRRTGEVVAYIPEEVYEDIETLYGKELTLVFGEDNIVALVTVTDDAVIDNELITKVNLADDKIAIGGTEYKYASDVEIYVNNIAFGNGEAQLKKVLDKVGVDTASTRTLTKAVKANAILNQKDKVERLDITISGKYYIKVDASTPEYTFETDKATATDMIEEYIVEEIKSKGNVMAVGTATALYNYKDLIEEEEEPRVLKDGKEISLDEIEEGDVLTIVSKKDTAWEMQTIYVSSEKATGEITNVARSLAITVDGEKYYAAKNAMSSTSGELEDATTAVDYDVLKDIDGEESEVYLNILGEYVAVVTESTSTDGQFAVIDTVYKLNYDEENDDEEYRKIKVLLPDGTAPKYTVKYDEKTDKTIGAATVTLDGLDDSYENALIKFKANSNGVIMIDELTFVQTATKGKIDGDKVIAIAPLADTAKVDYDDKTITLADNSKEYDFSDAIFMAYDTTEKELSVVSKGWNSLVGKGNATVADTKLADGATNEVIYVVEDDTASVLDVKLVYVGQLASFTSSDIQYAVVKDVTNNRDKSGRETIKLVTLDGTVTYEVATTIVDVDADRIEVGDFVQYKVSDDKVTEMNRVIDVIGLTNLDVEAAITNALVDTALKFDGTHKTVMSAITANTTKKEDLTFDFNEKRPDRIYYVDDVVARVNINEDGAIVFDLRNMDEDAEGIEFLTESNLAELDGEIIIAIDSDYAEDGAEVLVIVR